MKDQIEFTEFLEVAKKLEIKVGKVIDVQELPKSKKLLVLTVDFGNEKRTVVTNIKPLLNPIDESVASNLSQSLCDNSLLNKKFLFVTNLKPVNMMGVESTAMIMPGSVESGEFVVVSDNTKPGITIL